MVGTTKRFSLVLAMLAGIASSVMAETPHTGQNSATSISATLFRDIARRQNPAVVSIIVRSRGRTWDLDEQEAFRLFGMVPPEPTARVQRLLGSGFVISAAGEILTNNHVIEGADTIEVSLFGEDRKRYHAVLVGSDPLTDSALIRLENPPPTQHAVTLGDSSLIEPGDRMPDETAAQAPAGESLAADADDRDGLTLDELTSPAATRLSVPPSVDGALVVDVAFESPADEAGLAAGDIIRVINRRPVHSAAEATAELRRIERHKPIFLLVWRRGAEVFLQMRKD